MQLFEENKQRICCCNDAIKKGIYTKSLENNNFSIYGNLMHGKSILLNYHGKLIKNNDIVYDDKSKIPNVYLYYCFDNNWNDKKIVNMNVCNKNGKLSYCSIIDIPENENINIAFTNDSDEWDTDEKGTYYIKLCPDVEKAILKRYNLDFTPPTIVSDNLPSMPISLFERIKGKVSNLLTIIKTKLTVIS